MAIVPIIIIGELTRPIEFTDQLSQIKRCYHLRCGYTIFYVRRELYIVRKNEFSFETTRPQTEAKVANLER